jgi:hypothetical protein
VTEAQSTPEPVNRVLVAHRVVQAGILLTLIWKWSYFVTSTRVYAQIPLEDTFFPDWLRSVWTVAITYLVTVAVIALNLVTASRPLQLACSWITLIGTSILCVHQASYNDMTFVTAWWASLWAVWYVHRMEDEDQASLLRRAALLSRLIIAVILLGGAAGKWTAEYWSGEVLYDIYFRDRDFWLFNLLRANFEPDALREIATLYSRQVIVLETVAGLGIWLLPPKWAAAVGVILLASIALFSNFLLFSVLMSLIGLAAVGFFVERRADLSPLSATEKK